MRIVFIILLIIHGLVHLAGFAKAFGYADITQLTKEISRPQGMAWLLAALLFVTAALQLSRKNNYWWITSSVAVVISQYLVFTSWQDAGYGTVVNMIIVLITVIGYASWGFVNKYRDEVRMELEQDMADPVYVLTETDIRHLPGLVKNYLRFTGAVGKPKVKNFKIQFRGQLRKSDESAWMPFTSEQYNFIDEPARLFFMEATMKHLPVAGYHRFRNAAATMDIRLFSLFRVQYQSGNKMDISETVTFFNDMCCMAPATLIDKRIEWLETGHNKVKASFSNNGVTVTAWLYFNDRGELINFVSDDRYAATGKNAMERMRWSTPLKEYTVFNGYKLPGYADAIYHYPKGDLCYGNFRLVNIEYNCKPPK